MHQPPPPPTATSKMAEKGRPPPPQQRRRKQHHRRTRSGCSAPPISRRSFLRSARGLAVRAGQQQQEEHRPPCHPVLREERCVSRLLLQAMPAAMLPNTDGGGDTRHETLHHIRRIVEGNGASHDMRVLVGMVVSYHTTLNDNLALYTNVNAYNKTVVLLRSGDEPKQSAWQGCKKRVLHMYVRRVSHTLEDRKVTRQCCTVASSYRHPHDTWFW